MKAGAAFLLGVIIGIVAWLWVMFWPFAGVKYAAFGLITTGFYFAHGGAWRAAPIVIVGTILGTIFAIITLVLAQLFVPAITPIPGMLLAIAITTVLAALVTTSGPEVLSSLPTVLGVWAAELMTILQVMGRPPVLDWAKNGPDFGQFLYAGIVGVLFVGFGIFYPNKWLAGALFKS